MSGAARRQELPVGDVPSYGAFKQHIWHYRDSEGSSAVWDPPWVYSVLVENEEDCSVVLDVIHSLVSEQAIEPTRAEVVRHIQHDGTLDCHEVRFADLGLLHAFLSELACRVWCDFEAKQIGEFLMWTLGFRWV